MKKYCTILFILVILACIAGCTGNSTQEKIYANTNKFEYKSTIAPAPLPTTDSRAIKITPIPDVSHESYIGNKNSKIFHEESCKTLPKEKNRIYFSTREEAIGYSYTPCKNCKP